MIGFWWYVCCQLDCLNDKGGLSGKTTGVRLSRLSRVSGLVQSCRHLTLLQSGGVGNR